MSSKSVNNPVYDVVFFEEKAEFRLKKSDLRLAERIIKKDSLKYDNLSHYFRCAIIKQNREESKRLKI